VVASLFTFRQLPTIAALLAEHGASLATTLAEAGISEPSSQGEITAPLAKVQRFLELVARRLGSSSFGLDLAARIPEGAFAVTEFVVRTSPTVQDALGALCELATLINPALEMRYVADHESCEVHFTFAGAREGLGSILNEYTVAYIAKQFSTVLGEQLPLVRAWFAHRREHDQELVSRRLGCPVSFDGFDCGFAVAGNVIARPLPGANPPLFEFLLKQARAQLANLGTHDVIAQVTRVIEARISDEDLSSATIAKALGTSQRSLQRQLSEAGTSYRNVLLMLRQRRRAELASSGLTDAEIAPRLGFASAKTMRRSLAELGGGDDDGT